MRYLRNTQDFFIKTLCKLKFSHNEATEEELSVIIKQQTWFMKTLAIELRLTSINKQRSHTQSLINCLLDYNTTYTEGGGRGSADLSRTVLSHTSQYHSLELFHSSMKSRLLQFLDLVSFHDIGLGDIMLEHFNTTSVMQVLSSCEEQAPESGLVSINIPQVHQLLVQEINLAQQGNSMGPLAHRDVLLACLQDGCLDDLISPACGVILSLMANLRQSVFKDGLRDTNIDNGLQVILKGILNLIVTSSGSLQRARANLYGALLYYLQMCESELSKDTNPLASRGVSGVLEGKQSATEKLAKEALHVIYGFGDAILEVICRDACDGLNVQSDSILVQSLDPAQPLRHLYIYESTMSLLSRLAMTAQGASALLNSGLMMRLAECSVYDAKPNLSHGLSAADSMDCEGFNPSVSSRYRQILLPCLKLCQTVLISLGTENENAADQVMKFIVAHGDVFHSTLRGQTVETCDSLEELSLLTAVLCRAASFTAVSQSEEERELMFRGQVSRIQRRLGSLISKYLLVDDWMKMFGAQESLDESERCRMTVYVHEIAANISTYCRNVVANSTHDPSYCRVLFGPSLSEALDQGDFTSKSTSRDDHKQLQTRLDSLSDCSEAVRGETGSDAVAIETKQEVRDRLERQTSIIQLLCLILENSLYIVWRHLDFYLTNCIPENRDTSLFRAHHSSVSSMRHLTEKSLNVSSTEQDKPKSIISSGITQEELDTLKETTPSVIDEPLLQKLAAIEQCYASKRTHFGYIGALSRRLRRLINLHCC
ncbi:NUP205 [Bugula neritina]|uniref:NUP205 n=1 Tax=Bugula neritina TaxID=10212 RepID=A0A7J7JX93_BUGNE|nr:NUP205 [Bugula neritina]